MQEKIAENCGTDGNKYSDEFIHIFVPMIREMRKRDTDWEKIEILPSMNSCLEILSNSLKEYKNLLRKEGWLHKDDPVEGFDCTLGELPEKARKMKRALQFYSSTIAVIIKRSHPTNTKNNPYEETRIDTPYPNIADDALTFKDK